MSDITRSEALKELKEYVEGLDMEYATPFDKAILFAIASLETDEAYQLEYERTTKNDLALIHTEGLDEGIRCAMCTNSIQSDRGCDGGCVVNNAMYKEVMDVIENHIVDTDKMVEPTTKNDCENCIHNKGVLECDMYGCKYEPTTKNDLGVECKVEDYINKRELIQKGMMGCDANGKMLFIIDAKELDSLPSVYPKNDKPKLEDFIAYAKKEFGIDITVKESDNPDTFEKLFGEKCNTKDITFKGDDAVNRLSVRDMLYANAYELEYPDGSSEYVVNRDEAIKYLMELPCVYPKIDNSVLEDIKSEIQRFKDITSDSNEIHTIDYILSIFDKHISGKEQ